MADAPNHTINKLNGIPFLGLPPDLTTGNIFFVDSGHSFAVNDANQGNKPTAPFATIDYAIGQCTASNGDIIYVMPGHAETISAASGIALDVAGVSIVGLGNGDNRPTLTYSATTSTLVVSAKNTRIKNLRFVSAINNLATFVTLSANYSTVEDCEFTTSSLLEAYNFIGITTTYDYMNIKRCVFIQPSDPEGTSAAAGTGVIYVVDSEYVFVEDCKFFGNFETAIFHNKTTLVNQLWVKGCQGYNALSNGVIYVLVAAATGGDTDSLYTVPAATDVSDALRIGTVSDAFFYGSTTSFGNDGAGGAGATVAVATT